MIEFMNLPFKENDLEPFISKETIHFHYFYHHRLYVDKVNELILGTDMQNMTLEEIIKRTFESSSNQALYNNAGQVYNHNVYWSSVGFWQKADDGVKAEIDRAFGGRAGLKAKLSEEALKCFGSGWVWLVRDKSSKLSVMTTHNGDTPLVLGFSLLFNIDVWEHAYYLDYQNRRSDYVRAFIEHILKI